MKNYKFCSECGNKIENTHKFCVECGTPNTQSETGNKIDNSVDKVKSEIANISKELYESETIKNISDGAKVIVKETTKTVKYTGNKILTFLGILGFIILTLMIAYPFVTGNDFVIKSAFEANLGDNHTNYIGFIGEITAPIILPLIFIFRAFRDNEFITKIFPIIIGLIIFVLTIMD